MFFFFLAQQSLSEKNLEEITKKVFMDISIGGNYAGRIEIGLFGNTVNKTAENFLHLCLCDYGIGKQGKQLCYRGIPFHRVIPGFMAQGGDIINRNGSGGESIYGREFEDENFEVKHSGPGYISMANGGVNTNSCQFFITYTNTSWLDGHHVVFGKVTDGLKVIKKVEEYGSQEGTTKEEVIIQDCGIVN